MKTTAGLPCTVLLIGLLLSILHPAVADDPSGVKLGARLATRQDAGRDTEMLERRLKELLPAVGPLAGRARATEERIASVLQKIGKNLILERTRGLKEVELYRRAAPAVVLVVTNEGFGSGAIIDRQGHVITNWHVVSTFLHVVVVFKPKDSTELKKELAFQATVEKVDHVTDLALLQINTPPRTFTSLPLGDASTLAVGQDVHAIGHPEGEVWTYTKGIISQVRAKNS